MSASDLRMKYKDFGMNFEAETEVLGVVFGLADSIEMDLIETAKRLKAEANSLIKLHDKIHKRVPPVSLSMRTSTAYFGPRLTWVRMDKKKRVGASGRPTFFTQEVPGMRNGRYRHSIFACYSDELSAELTRIEDECVVVRKRTQVWREMLKGMRQLKAMEGNHASTAS